MNYKTKSALTAAIGAFAVASAAQFVTAQEFSLFEKNTELKRTAITNYNKEVDQLESYVASNLKKFDSKRCKHLLNIVDELEKEKQKYTVLSNSKNINNSVESALKKQLKRSTEHESKEYGKFLDTINNILDSKKTLKKEEYERLINTVKEFDNELDYHEKLDDMILKKLKQRYKGEQK